MNIENFERASELADIIITNEYHLSLLETYNQFEISLGKDKGGSLTLGYYKINDTTSPRALIAKKAMDEFKELLKLEIEEAKKEAATL